MRALEPNRPGHQSSLFHLLATKLERATILWPAHSPVFWELHTFWRLPIAVLSPRGSVGSGTSHTIPSPGHRWLVKGWVSSASWANQSLSLGFLKLKLRNGVSPSLQGRLWMTSLWELRQTHFLPRAGSPAAAPAQVEGQVWRDPSPCSWLLWSLAAPCLSHAGFASSSSSF